jgi:hypothetical protein
MSLAPSFKFLALTDSASAEYPEVLSIGQIVRMLGVMTLLGLAIGLLNLPSLLGT